MSTVTSRINEIKQIRGGYLPPKDFNVIRYGGRIIDSEMENILPQLMGLTVDYLTRYTLDKSDKRMENAFRIPLMGYKTKLSSYNNPKLKQFVDYVEPIDNIIDAIKNGNDNERIIAACQLCTYDVWFREPLLALMIYGKSNHTEVIPDSVTIVHIRQMVERSVTFLKSFEKPMMYGCTFKGGYSDVVTDGDCDYVIKGHSIVDFKVSKNLLPSPKDTLQILLYWILSQESGIEYFKGIENIAIFNPRINTQFYMKTSEIPWGVIDVAKKDIICY